MFREEQTDSIHLLPLRPTEMMQARQLRLPPSKKTR